MGLIVAVIIVVVLAAALYLVRFSPWSRHGGGDRQRMRRKYGREYDRLLAQKGEDHDAVGQELAQREQDRAALEIKPLTGDERARLASAWQAAETGFVDDPGSAARNAEQIVGETLAKLGYPAGDAERQLALASVDHADGLSEFRDGHELLTRSHSAAPGVDSTEQLRQAMLHFRVFFDDLTGDSRKGIGSTDKRHTDRKALV
ncbi:hypothetical protein [Actinospica robiniae]|uniref:hypothetical protein n=1 Tax=Actinospica robiniae TaxID=304901 RepID=UPI000556B1E2|nr:hypothetical protein [Actinospica robiniae]